MSTSHSGDSRSRDLDPEVADLIESEDNGRNEAADQDVPDFSELFGEGESGQSNQSDDDQAGMDEAGDSELQSEGFRIPSRMEEEPKSYFADKGFYKKVLTGEGEVSKRVHSLLSSFLNAKDSQDRSLYRSKLIPAVWELQSKLSERVGGESLTTPKRLMLRFAILLPTMISQEQRDMLSRIIFENQTGEPIYYVDEWLEHVARGAVKPSAVDETKLSKQNQNQKVNTLLEKTRGKYQAQVSLVKGRASELQQLEESLEQKAQNLRQHDTLEHFDNIIAPYTEGQRSEISEINTIVRKISSLNKDLARQIDQLDDLQDELDNLKDKEAELGGDQDAAVDSKTIVSELNTVRQMAKMSVGRQGNHFPVLLKQYLRGANIAEIGTRENVLKTLAEVERLDPELFTRTFKMQTNRIVPHVVLVPCYGEHGICWEPFERYNRATSRGRIAIPMYPKDLRTAVIAACGDLRWQVAKEKAQHYWMEEGLTGWYYGYFTDKKMKGDVKDAFVQDYILWIRRESEGTQKMTREARDIFWRYVPFPQDVKDMLKNRGFVYNELYKKDQNRALSDGY